MKTNYFLSSVFCCVAWAGSAFAVDTSLSLKNGLKVDVADGIELSVGLRLQADAVQFNDDVTELEDDTDFRRARVITKLDLYDWRLRADYDVGISDGRKNFYMQYRGLNRQRITVGNQTAPFSMDDSSSSMHQPFLERSIASALSPGILLGLSYRRWGDNWSVNAGVFGDELSEQDRRRLRGESINMRSTYAPIRNQFTTLHFGLSGELRNIDDGEPVRYRVRPGSRLSDRRLIDTRFVDDVDSSDSIGVEFAVAHGDLRVQAEITQAYLDTTEGDLNFNSHYIMASKLIAGGNYRYSHSWGAFKPVKPEGRWGALELAARYATLDLTDGFVEGGEQSEATVGLSWIINPQLRATVNYSAIEAKPNRNGVDEDVSVWMLRLQLDI